MQEKDLAGVQHWDSIYQRPVSNMKPGWTPKNYTELTLAHILLSEIERVKPKTVLEVGCGNSTWLPYIAKFTGASVAGIDYSEDGCNLARERLKVEQISADIHCLDIFDADATTLGQFDLVYSLGVVEHFSDLQAVLAALLQFVRPGGYLLSEIPNLRSAHGILSWIWQPQLLAMHMPLKKKDLIRSYHNLDLQDVRGHYRGVFSLNVINWKKYPRWPSVAAQLLPAIEKFVYYADRFFFRKIPIFWGIPFFAPYIYVVGQKPRSHEIEQLCAE